MPLTVKSATGVAGTTVTNTTTETSLYQESFPANFWLPGKAVRLKVCATVPSTNSTDTLANAFRFGTDGSTLSNDDSIGANAATDVANDDIIVLDVEGTCEDVGDGTYRVVWTGFITDADASGVELKHVVGVSTAFNPALATYGTFSATWSVASASNQVAARSAVCLELTQ